MARARAGQPLHRTPIGSASTQNKVLEAMEDYQLRRRLGTAQHQAAPLLSTDLIKVVNGTSTALRAGEVVELNGHALTTLSAQHPWFTAAVPDETRPFAIMLQDLPNDSAAIGLAQISGVCPALIDVQATTDLWAFVESGQDLLKGDRFWGDVRLLYEPPGTGEQLLWVSFEKSPDTWFGKADTPGIAVDATGTVSVWTGSTPTDSTHNIASCLNWTGIDIATGGRVKVQRIDRKPRAFPLECPA